MRLYSLTCLTLVLLTTAASAQLPGTNVRPYARPAYSPYLNLNRPGGNTATNYFGLVRPQLTYNSAIQQLDQRTTDLQQPRETVVGSQLPPTGHQTDFLTHRRHFLTKGTGPR